MLITSRLPGFYYSFAADNMDEVVFIHDGLVAFGARFGARLACCEVSCKCGHWNIQLAVLAEFGLIITSSFMFFIIRLWELFWTVWAFLLSVKLFLVFLLEVYVVHFMTDWTLLYVSSAIAEMCCHLRFREVLEAIITSLYRFTIHLLEIF